MGGAGVDFQLGELLPCEAVLREHALDRLAEHLGRAAVELLAERALAQAAREARVAVVELLVELLAGDGDLLGVDDDDEVAGVDVRRVLGLVLAAERVGDLRRETPERLPFGIDEVPAAGDLARLCGPGLHLTKKRRTDVRRARMVAAETATAPDPVGVAYNTSVAVTARANSLAPPCEGWRTYGPPTTPCATRPTGTTRRPRARRLRNGSPASISARVGRRLEDSVPG